MANEYFVNIDDLTAVANAIRTKGETTGHLVFPGGFVSAIGDISTGVELNFTVVGGTSQPSSPAANTIWVNTDTSITSWCFDTQAPANPTHGDVWVKIGTVSETPFNALVQNKLQVYPASAYQYINNAWAEKEAKTYQDGTWVDWIPAGALYWNGNKRTEITGGWTFGLGRGTGTNYPLGKYVDGEDGVTMYLEGKANSIQMSTTNKIELGPYKTIFAEAVDNTLPDGNFFLKYGSAHPLSDGIARVSFITNTGDAKRASIDISGVTGSYYIAIEAFTGGTADGSAKVVKVWLE